MVHSNTLTTLLVKQTGYAKNPISGNWISLAGGYDFPIDIEGSKHYSARPI